MENYRADKGSDTYMVMLMAAANAGNTKRFDELLLEIQETNTKLDARDYFKVMGDIFIEDNCKYPESQLYQ